ncbi:MAG TPA: hypothetical protein VIV11_38420 [Kofleriaceae bacterium]
MSAFRRRTTFATPFILTVAACGSGKDKPKPEASPFLETWTVSMANMKCDAQLTAANPPAPRQDIECPPGMTGGVFLTVAEIERDKCAVVPLGCANAACAKPVIPCPLPLGKQLVKKLAYVWTIEKRGKLCHAEEEDHDCPPGVDCNPPAPREFPCPPGVTEDKPMQFAELPDTTCVIVPEGCQDTGCATEKIACPPMK